VLGTSLATSPIMSSNFVGARVFTLGLYTDVFVEDDFPYVQNSLFTGVGLKLDHTTISDTSITQVHVLDDIGLVSYYHLDTSVIRQNHIIIPLGQYLETFVSQPAISQNHNIKHNDIEFIGFTTNGVFNQTHFMVANGQFVVPSITDPVQFRQNHIMISNDQFVATEITDPVDFNQNHVMVSIGSYSTIDISDPTDFSQNHVMISDGLVLDPVKVGKPFVNPSTRRVVYASTAADNAILLNVDKENSVIIINALNNKYK
jgi:hypothetical protein